MSTSFSLYPVVRRSLAVAVFAGAGIAVAGAQSAAPAAQAEPAAQPESAQSVNFKAAAVPNFSSSLDTTSSSSSSSEGYNATEAAQTQMASLEKTFELPGAHAMQYGQRRRYGAPRYRGANSNADGSEKYTGYVGGGFGLPVGDNFNYASTSWGLEGGVGRNFNRHVGVNLEFDYDHFGMTGQTLQNQQNLYNYGIDLYNQQAAPADQISDIAGLDGNSHIWSFSLDPIYNFHQGEGLGGYVTGGVGSYHKVANFTVPAEGEYCDYYYGCYTYTANQVIDHYTSNAFGVNAGVGFTYKFSRFANEKFFGEVRWVYLLNSARPGVTLSTVTPDNVSDPNFFPQNSNHTSYLPVKFGIRF